ncbi:unnamed protein product [Peniophora sp. CBMAI 1063]|nr:unnamed protein product [Peniophora sp. CBMAI 1063]
MKRRNIAWMHTAFNHTDPSQLDVTLVPPTEKIGQSTPYPWIEDPEDFMIHLSKWKSLNYYAVDDLPDDRHDLDLRPIFRSPNFAPQKIKLEFPSVAPESECRVLVDGELFGGHLPSTLEAVHLQSCAVRVHSPLFQASSRLKILRFEWCRFIGERTLSDVLLAIHDLPCLNEFSLLATTDDLLPPANIHALDPAHVIILPALRRITIDLPFSYATWMFRALELDSKCVIHAYMSNLGTDVDATALCTTIDAAFGNWANAALSGSEPNSRVVGLAVGFEGLVGGNRSGAWLSLYTESAMLEKPPEARLEINLSGVLDVSEDILRALCSHIVVNWTAIRSVTSIAGMNMPDGLWRDILVVARDVNYIDATHRLGDLPDVLVALLNSSPSDGGRPPLASLATVCIESLTELASGAISFATLMAALGRAVTGAMTGPEERELRVTGKSIIHDHDQTPSSYKVPVNYNPTT